MDRDALTPVSALGVSIRLSDYPTRFLVVGLGFLGPVDEEALTEVEREFEARQTAVQAKVACLADPSVCETLTRQGHVLQNSENVLGRRLAAPENVSLGTGITVNQFIMAGPMLALYGLSILIAWMTMADASERHSHGLSLDL